MLYLVQCTENDDSDMNIIGFILVSMTLSRIKCIKIYGFYIKEIFFLYKILSGRFLLVVEMRVYIKKRHLCKLKGK